MGREQEYRHLANTVFKRASDEERLMMKAQWKVLGVQYLELASQSKKIGENDTVYDSVPWDRFREN